MTTVCHTNHAPDLAYCRAAGWASHQGMRESMEDGLVFVDAFVNAKSVLAAVLDGHGGAECVTYVE